jgi:hypothetical protein
MRIGLNAEQRIAPHFHERSAVNRTAMARVSAEDEFGARNAAATISPFLSRRWKSTITSDQLEESVPHWVATICEQPATKNAHGSR